MLLPDLLKAKIRTKEESLIKTSEYIKEDNLSSLGLGKKYFVKTYGCQMNEHDTENIKAILEDMAYTESLDMAGADLILLNTCAIRENAHNKVFGMVGRIKKLKESKPHLIAGLCGCMAQEEVVIEEILNKYDWLDLVFGTHNIYNLPHILNRALAKKEIEIEVLSGEGSVLENIPVKRDNKIKAWVNIMYGCDKFCTYCIVPYTRGKQRSRQPKFIIEEVNELVKNGYQEVTLLGQNVNAYGKDLESHPTMASLLAEVAQTGIPRVRFVTSHPWDFTEEMIMVIKNNANVMPYIHLPVQTGSNKILKLMGRRYTKELYLKLYQKIKQEIPSVTITTDIIVGFPGESDADFEETINLVNECQFDYAFTFLFSPRAGTPAAKMKDEVPLTIKKAHLQELNKLINKYSRQANARYLNQIVPVLIEGPSTKDKTMLVGYTDTMKLVNVKVDQDYIGQIINVKITNIKTWSMDGELI